MLVTDHSFCLSCLGTGDIVLDMENQVKANIIRIQLLEKQNEGLRNSVRKLQTMQAQQDGDQHVEDCNGGDRWATHVRVCKLSLLVPLPLNSLWQGHMWMLCFLSG